MAVGTIKWDPHGLRKKRHTKKSPLTLFGFGRRRRARQDAQAALAGSIQQFEGLSTENIYKDVTSRDLMGGEMENVYEDMTIDQRAAEFQRQQSQQGQANILDMMRGGGQFNAGNIQALVQQSQLGAQQASADIGRQEQQAQRMRLAEQARIGDVERGAREQALMTRLQGQEQARNLEWQKQQGLMATRAGQAQAAAQAEQAGWSNLIGAVGAVAGMATGVGGIIGALKQ